MSPVNGIAARGLIVDHAIDRGTVRALDCEDLRIDSGTSLAIMGPSGCGKSTLLGLLAGLAVPTHGTVTIGGVVVSALGNRDRVRFRRRAVGMVYQADNLLPHLTVEENIGLQLAIARPTSATFEVTDLLERVEMGRLATRFPDQLSGGQRQRVAVARAIVHRPGVILADEPTGALDDENADRVIRLLLDVHHRLGATFVLVTHDPRVADRVDRRILLSAPDPIASVRC